MEFVAWPQGLSQEQYELRRDVCTGQELNRLTADTAFQKHIRSPPSLIASKFIWALAFIPLLVGTGIGWAVFGSRPALNEVSSTNDNANESLRSSLKDAEANHWWLEQEIRDLQSNAWYDGHRIQELHTKLAKPDASKADQFICGDSPSYSDTGQASSHKLTPTTSTLPASKHSIQSNPPSPEALVAAQYTLHTGKTFQDDGTDDFAEDTTYHGPGWTVLAIVTLIAWMALYWGLRATKKKNLMSKQLDKANAHFAPEIERGKQEIERQSILFQHEAEKQEKQLKETEVLVRELQKQIQAQERQIASVSQDLALKSKQIQELDVERQAVATQLEAAKDSAQEQAKANAKTLKVLESKEEDLKNLVAQRGLLEEEKELLIHEFEAQAVQVEVLLKDVSAAQSQNKVLQDAHDDARHQLQQAKQELHEQQSERDLEADVQSLSESFKQMKHATSSVSGSLPGTDAKDDIGPHGKQSKIPRLAVSPTAHTDKHWQWQNQCFSSERDSSQDILTTQSTISLEEAAGGDVHWLTASSPQIEGYRSALGEIHEEASDRSWSPLPLGAAGDGTQEKRRLKSIKRFKPRMTRSNPQSPVGYGDQMAQLTEKDAKLLNLTNNTILAEAAKQVADLAEEVVPADHPARQILRHLKKRLQLTNKA